MWIFTKHGFFSAVCARQGNGKHGQPIDPDRIMVRARVREHLEFLRIRFSQLLGECEIQESAGTDYAFRLFVQKAAWTQVVSGLAEETDYDNFKSEVARHQEHAGAAYEHSLHDVWSVMYRLQSDSKRVDNESLVDQSPSKSPNSESDVIVKKIVSESSNPTIPFVNQTSHLMPVNNLTVYSVGDVQVFVCRVDANNCRVVKLDHQGRYFPESVLVPRNSLVEVARQPSVNRERLQPRNGEIYSWDPPATASEAEYIPPDEVPPNPPKRVLVTRKDWETSRVSEVDSPLPNSTFRVYNHHLIRD